MIKAVIFDVDGCLIDTFESNLKFFQDLMIKTGYTPPTREEYKLLFHKPMIEAIKSLIKSNAKDEIERVFKIGKARDVEYPVELVDAPKGLKETIVVLSEKYVLGIVTSRIKDNVFESPAMQSIEKYFKTVVTFEDTEKHKPHPEPLLLATKQLGIDPSEAIYVGDSETDIKAAKAAGMKCILFPKSEKAGADAYAESFVDLPRLIKSLQS